MVKKSNKYFKRGGEGKHLHIVVISVIELFYE